MKEKSRKINMTPEEASRQQQLAQQVTEFFKNRYLLRYNVMTQKEEYCPMAPLDDENARQNTQWEVITDRVLNRMVYELMLEGVASWGIDVERYVHSTLVPEYNPVLHYLQNLPQWNRRYDYIGSFARRVPTTMADFEAHFHRWFLAMVAQWMGINRDHGNAQVLMLIGQQGQFKSTWCKIILPEVLRPYFIDDIKMDNAEQAERVLCRMALVNIDEYNAKTDREQAKIKRILTERNVQVRQMRSSEYTLLRRMASFTATTNDTHPLCDPTGSRRYLCVPVAGNIQVKRIVLHDKMYAQAVYELAQGARYWPNRREEARLTAHNRQFQRPASADEILLSFFRPARRDASHFLRTVDIHAAICQHLRGADVPSMKMLTVALARNRFQRGARSGHYGWYVRRVAGEGCGEGSGEG